MKLDRQSMRAASYSTVGLEFVLSVLFGFFGGRWLDAKFGTDPWIAFAGLGFGVAAGFRSIYRASKRMQDDSVHDGFRNADVGRGARFAMNERLAATRARRAAQAEEARAAAKQTPNSEADGE